MPRSVAGFSMRRWRVRKIPHRMAAGTSTTTAISRTVPVSTFPCPLGRHAERTLRLRELCPCVRAARRALLDVARVDDHLVALDDDREPVQATRGGATVVLA